MSELKFTATPNSSNVLGYHYNPESFVLSVKFKSGGTYHYQDVPPKTVTALKEAKSFGSALHSLVKKGGFNSTMQVDTKKKQLDDDGN